MSILDLDDNPILGEQEPVVNACDGDCENCESIPGDENCYLMKEARHYE